MGRTHTELDKAVAVHETQIGRIVSDIESEKETRKRVNIDFVQRLEAMDDRQRKSDSFQSKMIGGLIVLNVLMSIFLSLKG